MQSRILRAVDIVPSNPKGYASPGIPNLDWLNTGGKAVVIDINGKPQSALSITGSVSYAPTPDTKEFAAPFQKGSAGISAVEQSGSISFVFDNAQQKWLQVVLKQLSLSVKFVDGTSRDYGTSDVQQGTVKALILF